MRMTEKRRRILEALRPPTSEDEWIKRGNPPYCDREVAQVLGGNHRNYADLLRHMWMLRLVVPEIKVIEVWREGLKSMQYQPGFVKRKVTGYWVAETIEEDRATVAERLASHEGRTE